MEPTRKPRVKICCNATPEEAALAIAYGASAVGLVSSMPSGPGVISEEMIRRIATTVPPAIGTFLLTSETDVEAIIAQQRRCRTNCLQLCDRIRKGTLSDLRSALPGIGIVQVVHVVGPASLGEALEDASECDALLLDSGRPDLPVKELGGTGRVHNWLVSKSIRAAVGIPVFLAGGLTASNVRDAVDQVGPFAVDVCSGVRTNGRLDERKLAAFFDAVETDRRPTAPGAYVRGRSSRPKRGSD